MKIAFADCEARPGQRLTHHLDSVARECVRGLEGRQKMFTMAAFAGLCHDLGKASFYFQKLLNGKGIRSSLSDHSRFGACMSLWATSAALDPADSFTDSFTVFFAIRRHHGNLGVDLSLEFDGIRGNDDDLVKQFEATDLQGLEEWLRKALAEYGLSAPSDSLSLETCMKVKPNGLKVNGLIDSMKGINSVLKILEICGTLFRADKLDSAGWLSSGLNCSSACGLTQDNIALYRARLVPVCEDFVGRRAAMTKMRAELSDAVMLKLASLNFETSKTRLFTLTAPTGAGKTLAGLEAAIFLSGQKGPVIYCLPYTTIIEQNAEVFKRVYETSGRKAGFQDLMVHHHLSKTDRTGDDLAEGTEELDGKLFTESWAGGLVVTTFNQIIDTMYSLRNSCLKRLPRLRGATLIFDEVQVIPLKYWKDIGDFLEALATGFEMKVILMTATKPHILDGSKTVELNEKSKAMFRALSRTRIFFNHFEGVDLLDFAKLIAQRLINCDRNAMIVLNRRKSVERLYEAVKPLLKKTGVKVLPLSANLTPLDRRKRIAKVKKAMEGGKKGILLITTQLIEAGVDISFDEVHRDLAPLDCLVQAAGRCNRNFESPSGTVCFWKLRDEKAGELWKRIYSSELIEATKDAVASFVDPSRSVETSSIQSDHDCVAGSPFIEEGAFPELVDKYFELCVQRARKAELFDKLSNLRLPEVYREYELIENRPNQSYFVIKARRDQKMFEFFTNREGVKNSDVDPVAIYDEKDFYERVISVAAPGHGGTGRVEPLPVEMYDEMLGYREKATEIIL